MQSMSSAAMEACSHSRQGLGPHVCRNAAAAHAKTQRLRSRASLRLCSAETLTIGATTTGRLRSLSLRNTLHTAACSDRTLAIWGDRTGHLWTWELLLEGSAARKVAGLDLGAAVTCLHADPSGSHQVRLRARHNLKILQSGGCFLWL